MVVVGAAVVVVLTCVLVVVGVGAVVVVVSIALVLVVGIVVLDVTVEAVAGADERLLELVLRVVAAVSLLHAITSTESMRYDRTLLMTTSVSPTYRFGRSTRRRPDWAR